MRLTDKNVSKILNILETASNNGITSTLVNFSEYPRSNKTTKIQIVGLDVVINGFRVLIEFNREDDIDAFNKLITKSVLGSNLLVVKQTQQFQGYLYTVLNVQNNNIDDSFICSARFLASVIKSSLFNVVNYGIKGGKTYYSCNDSSSCKDDVIRRYEKLHNRTKDLFYLDIVKINGLYIVTEVKYGDKLYELSFENYGQTEIRIPNIVNYVLLTQGYELYSLKKNNMQLDKDKKATCKIKCEKYKTY